MGYKLTGAIGPPESSGPPYMNVVITALLTIILASLVGYLIIKAVEARDKRLTRAREA